MRWGNEKGKCCLFITSSGYAMAFPVVEAQNGADVHYSM